MPSYLARTLRRRQLVRSLPAGMGAAWAGSSLSAPWLTGCGARPAGPAAEAPLVVHVDRPLGSFDRLSGVQGSPYPEVSEDVEHVEAYRAHRIERARFPQDCHANELTLAAIFPDEGADPDDPTSYRFEAIDRHVQAALDAGVRILWQSSYDVGLSDRWHGRNLGGRVIRDLALWERVLTRCLEHFTIGWADGFDRAVADVEFLNEPNGLGGYDGEWDTMIDAFFRFLAVVGRHNESHPDAPLRAVGPGMPFSLAEWGTFRRGLDGLCALLAERGVSLPVFSFHTYGADTSPLGNAELARQLRAMLDDHGLSATELWDTEWQATDFLVEHLGLDAARMAAATPAERALFAQATASYTLSCKARWQGVVTGSYYYRAGLRAWPPDDTSPRYGDGTAGFFSPEQRIGALALAELLTARIAERTPQRCAIELAEDPLLTATGLSGGGAAALIASIDTRERPLRLRFRGAPAPSAARAVRIDTDGQVLATQELPFVRAADGDVEISLVLEPLEARLIELDGG